MTREQAIYMLKGMRSVYDFYTRDRFEALSIAIEALEQEHYTDAINRQDAIDALCEMLHDCFGVNDEELDAVITTLNELPPVTPKPNRCNQCKYYEGVHKVQGHAPCSFLKCGGVLWDWYCSNYELYKEDEENGIN